MRLQSPMRDQRINSGNKPEALRLHVDAMGLGFRMR